MDRIPLGDSRFGQAFRLRTPLTFGDTLIAPLRSSDSVLGLVIARRESGDEPFTDEHMLMLTTFADQTGLALEWSNTQRRLNELALVSERDRIARDLHDHVIQRLFATGLSLQGTIPRVRAVEVQQRLSETVDELQDIIQKIRSTIFDLHSSGVGSTRLRQRLEDVMRQLATPGIRQSTHFSGPLSVVDAVVADHAEAVLREAVTNAVRHSKATSIAATITVGDDLELVVTDDGIGIDDSITPSGLANLRTRAQAVGGTFEVETVPGGGTRLRWSAPLSA